MSWKETAEKSSGDYTEIQSTLLSSTTFSFHHQQKWKIQFSAHIIYTIKNLTTQKNPT